MSDLDARSFVKRQGKLVPADIMADELLSGIAEGREVLVSIRRPRNPRHHRLLFALLRKVRDNNEQWASDQELLDDLKLATGLFETRVNLVTKKAYAVPGSISFASMSQDAFRVWFDQVLVVLATNVLGCTTEELRNEIIEMVEPGGRAA
jgi:hypothetical protein